MQLSRDHRTREVRALPRRAQRGTCLRVLRSLRVASLHQAGRPSPVGASSSEHTALALSRKMATRTQAAKQLSSRAESYAASASSGPLAAAAGPIIANPGCAIFK